MGSICRRRSWSSVGCGSADIVERQTAWSGRQHGTADMIEWQTSLSGRDPEGAMQEGQIMGETGCWMRRGAECVAMQYL